MKYKLKEHVSIGMLSKVVRENDMRIVCTDTICHIPEMLNAEYDIYFNFETKAIEDFGLGDDGLFDKLLALDYVEVLK